jgi:hypothetical protein
MDIGSVLEEEADDFWIAANLNCYVQWGTVQCQRNKSRSPKGRVETHSPSSLVALASAALRSSPRTTSTWPNVVAICIKSVSRLREAGPTDSHVAECHRMSFDGWF